MLDCMVQESRSNGAAAEVSRCHGYLFTASSCLKMTPGSAFQLLTAWPWNTICFARGAPAQSLDRHAAPRSVRFVRFAEAGFRCAFQQQPAAECRAMKSFRRTCPKVCVQDRASSGAQRTTAYCCYCYGLCHRDLNIISENLPRLAFGQFSMALHGTDH